MKPDLEEDSLYLPGLEQPVLHSKQGRTTARVDADLGVDGLDVIVDRLRRQVEIAADFLHRAAENQQAQHLDLARRQASNERHLLAALAMARRLKHNGNRRAVERAALYVVPQPPHRLFRAERHAERPVLY